MANRDQRGEQREPADEHAREQTEDRPFASSG
jgi:hypothetical protein